MQWNDRAIVLSARRLGESSGLIHIITPEQGMYVGVDRGAFGKAKRGVYQPGNIIAAHWQARLAEHVGMINGELIDPIAAHILDDRRKLAALSSAALLIEKILSEREIQPVVFAHMEALVQALRHDGNWLLAYVLLEFRLLEHAGFGLDLARCASTGQSHDLTYVSPRSGRAVSTEAGRPYHEKLLALPEFLLSRQEAAHTHITQILDGVRLCGYFLHERIFAPRGHNLPAARGRFIEAIEKLALPEAVLAY